MVERGIVVFTKPWEMEDDRTRAIRRGITVEYLMTDNLEPVANDDGSMGVKYCKESLPSDKINSIKQVPGVYDLEYGLKVNKGKPQLTLVDMKYVGPVGA